MGQKHATAALKMTAAAWGTVDKFSTTYFKTAVYAHPSNYATLNALLVLKGLWSEGRKRQFSTNTTCNHKVNPAVQEQCVTESRVSPKRAEFYLCMSRKNVL